MELFFLLVEGRRHGFSRHQEVHGELPFAVQSRDERYGRTEGVEEQREVAPEGRRSGGMFHGEVAQGRGAKTPSATRS